MQSWITEIMDNTRKTPWKNQPITTLLTQAHGKSLIDETIYENRFKNTYDLNRMGAQTNIVTLNKLEVIGPKKLKGTKVIATDLRGGASLLIAGLIAEGITEIDNSEIIQRGYSNLVTKLTNIGAKVTEE